MSSYRDENSLLLVTEPNTRAAEQAVIKLQNLRLFPVAVLQLSGLQDSEVCSCERCTCECQLLNTAISARHTALSGNTVFLRRERTK